MRGKKRRFKWFRGILKANRKMMRNEREERVVMERMRECWVFLKENRRRKAKERMDRRRMRV